MCIPVITRHHRCNKNSILRLTTMSQCHIKVGAIDAAALGPFKKQAHGHIREKEVFSILVVISLLDTISGKSLKLLPPDVIFQS